MVRCPTSSSLPIFWAHSSTTSTHSGACTGCSSRPGRASAPRPATSGDCIRSRGRTGSPPDGAAEHARRVKPITGPDTISLQHIGRRRSRGHCAGRQLRPGHRGHAGRGAQCLPAGMSYEWTGLAYQELEVGAGRASSSLSALFVFLAAAQYELAGHWRCWRCAGRPRRWAPSGWAGAPATYMPVSLALLLGLASKNAILIVSSPRRRERGVESGSRAWAAASLPADR
jgi:hypothetical protein